MPRGEGSLEARPPGGLGLIATPEGFEHIDPRIFPFQIGPTAPLVLGRFDRPPRVLATAGREQASCDPSGDFRDLPDLFVVLRDESVNISLRVRDFQQRKSNGAGAGVLGDFVGVEWPVRTPTDGLSFFRRRFFDWLG